jgi:hypothetical protein
MFPMPEWLGYILAPLPFIALFVGVTAIKRRINRRQKTATDDELEAEHAKDTLVGINTTIAQSGGAFVPHRKPQR